MLSVTELQVEDATKPCKCSRPGNLLASQAADCPPRPRRALAAGRVNGLLENWLTRRVLSAEERVRSPQRLLCRCCSDGKGRPGFHPGYGAGSSPVSGSAE
jgi:hypothetical protein